MSSFEIIRYAIPFFALLIFGEMYVYRKKGIPFPFREAILSLAVGATYPLVSRSMSYVLGPFNQSLFELRPWTVPLHSWWGLSLLFVGVEFSYYWLHRISHKVRWLWASHSVHHSPHAITFSGAYRLGVTSLFSGLFVFFTPLYVLGFDPKAVATMFSINLIYQFWLHSELIPKLGWIEWMFNTPSHHRVHHAIDEHYLDKNFGGVLIVFDRIFGTFVEEKSGQPIHYGLVGKSQSYKFSTILFQEWFSIIAELRRISSWRDLARVTLGQPGTSMPSLRLSEPPMTKISSLSVGFDNVIFIAQWKVAEEGSWKTKTSDFIVQQKTA